MMFVCSRTGYYYTCVDMRDEFFDKCTEPAIFGVFSQCAGCFHTQDSKNGTPDEEEKQAENGKKEEERGKEQEVEREGDKTDSEMGTESLERQRNGVNR